MMDGNVALLPGIIIQIDTDFCPLARRFAHRLQCDGEIIDGVSCRGKKDFVLVRIRITGEHPKSHCALQVELRRNEPIVGIIRYVVITNGNGCIIAAMD